MVHDHQNTSVQIPEPGTLKCSRRCPHAGNASITGHPFYEGKHSRVAPGKFNAPPFMLGGDLPQVHPVNANAYCLNSDTGNPTVTFVCPLKRNSVFQIY